MTQTILNPENEMPSDEINPESALDTPLKTRGRLRRQKIIRWTVAGLAILALALGIRYYIHALSYESTDDAFIDGHIVPVSPRVDGHVAKVHVIDNQRVKAGDLLAKLDPSDFQARLDAADAALEAAKASDRARNIAVELTRITATAGLDGARESVKAAKAAVQKACAGIALSKAALDQAKAEADSAAARHRLDVSDLKRYSKMAKTQTVSPQDLDRAKTAEAISAAVLAAAKRKIDTQKAVVREAEASLKAEEANLRQADARLAAAESAPHQIRQSRSQADVSRADVDNAMAQVAQARLNLFYTKIYAPCDGFVTKKSVEPGQFVQAGQSLLAIVPHAVWITANFKETQLTRMRPGQPVEIVVDAYPKQIFRGHVDSIQHGTGARFSLLPPENATGNYVKVVQRVPVKIVFDSMKESAKMLLAPGMSVAPDVNVGVAELPAGVPPKDIPDKNIPEPEKNGDAAAK